MSERGENNILLNFYITVYRICIAIFKAEPNF